MDTLREAFETINHEVHHDETECPIGYLRCVKGGCRAYMGPTAYRDQYQKVIIRNGHCDKVYAKRYL